jgi:DNA-binding response OmpR family regulator
MEQNVSEKKILIIEDELPMLKALSDKLSREGFLILEARNGEEGLSAAIENHPDMIILDLFMPVMDGKAMMEKLREDVWGKEVPIIILTNLNPDDKTLNEIMASGPSYYFIKSKWRLDDLVKKIKEELNMAG